MLQLFIFSTKVLQQICDFVTDGNPFYRSNPIPVGFGDIRIELYFRVLECFVNVLNDAFFVSSFAVSSDIRRCGVQQQRRVPSENESRCRCGWGERRSVSSSLWSVAKQ
ncbi:hypothetical protein CDAR_443401 [Caerostris darwini]|uniref:Uncharacterized protein n=1 Tax=Caerostris darwini TaxID=1538125 RepID=A0AAV4R910_9ARAC|nr:hypothetical protein CDAR_443401 [Caerostris darwini]